MRVMLKFKINFSQNYLMLLVVCIGTLVVAHIASVFLSVFTTVKALALAVSTKSLLVCTGVIAGISHAGNIGGVRHSSGVGKARSA